MRKLWRGDVIPEYDGPPGTVQGIESRSLCQRGHYLVLSVLKDIYSLSYALDQNASTCDII